ncbi:MAG TPA: zinc ABC transporter substrate-binding protein, partial [Agitococcus sp.]|nr:zinc ABC transporter substrate-binding protein [Agitococcus sp.]
MSIKHFFTAASLLVISNAACAQIVTTIKPLTLIAQEVTQGIEQPVQLLPTGASAHHYALKPSQRVLLQKASLVIWVGNSHETFLQTTLKPLSNVLTFEQLPNLKKLAWRDLNTHQPQANTLDGHLWLDPENAIQLAYAIAQKRSQQNLKYAAQYQKNAQAFAQKTRQQVQQFQQKFKLLNKRDYVAYHDAYQYLEAPLGLHYRGSISISPEQKPSAKHLLKLKQQVTQQGWQ